MPQVIKTPLLASGVRDVYIAEGDKFAYVVTSGGVDVIDLVDTTAPVATALLPSPPTCIAVDWRIATGKVYVGTENDGVYSAALAFTKRGDFTSSLTQEFSTASSPALLSDSVVDIDVFETKLLIATNQGVDFVASGTLHSSRPLISGATMVHITEDDIGYWTTISGNQGEIEAAYGLLDTVNLGILEVDFRYSNSSNPVLSGQPPTDIARAKQTGSFPVLAFATPSGVTLVEERPFSEAAAGRLYLFDDEIVSVDFSNAASLNQGFLYALRPDVLGLTVLDLQSLTVTGTHPQKETNFPEPVTATRGQFVASGTNTIVRTTTLA